MQACAGVRVLEVGGGFGVTSLCGQLFAGLGASVTVSFAGRMAAETALSSEAQDYLLALLHTGKTVLPNDAEALVEDADIVLIDRSGGPLPAWATPKAFAALWPDKILCIVSLFGEDSPRAQWIGNELIAEAAGALMACNGYPERPPVTSGLPYALHTAALFCFSAAMTALWESDCSARGQVLDLAIVDCIIAILGNFLPGYFMSGKSPKRIGNRHTIAAPWNIYPASDGTVVICTGTGGAGWWTKIMTIMDHPELIDDPRFATEGDRVRNVEAVDAIVAAWTSERTMHDVVASLTGAGIPVSEISSIEAMLADPHYRDLRRMILGNTSDTRPGVGIPLKVGDWVSDPEPGAHDPDRPSLDFSQRGRGDRHGEGPLAGIRVLEFASRTSVPLAGRMMADFGAEIVKIEPAKGDALRGAGQQIGGSSYLFHINNAGKKSIVIDPGSPEGRALILDLAAHADIFMENLAPGSLERMGLGYEALRHANPNLIYCSVSGFGARSAYGSKRALDTVVQAACGLMYMTGYPDHHPVKLGISAVDLTTATVALASVLAALRERQSTGHGANVDLAMADVGAWMTQRAWPQLIVDGGHPVRLGNENAEACPHDAYPGLDEQLVAIAVETDAQWRSLAVLIDDQELRSERYATVAARLAYRAYLNAKVAAWAATRNADDIAARCQANGIPAAAVRNLVELCADPEVTRRGMIREIDHPTAGQIRLLGNPMALSRTPPRMHGGAPLLGQHSREILGQWLGLSADRLAALEAAGTILTTALPDNREDAPALAVSHAGQ